MISTQYILSLSSCKSLSDVKELDLSNQDLKVLDPCNFKGLKNLESLDVSRNSLRDIPNLNLPKLRRLNIEENLVNDLAFLKAYGELTELMVAGNPILSADKNIAVSLLPKLVLLDGADCQPLRKLEALGDKKLLPQISQVWKSSFKDNLAPGASEDEIAVIKKDFLRYLRRTYFECNEFSVKFKKFKVEALGDDLFEDEVRRLGSKVPNTPKRKLDKKDSVSESGSPSKRVASPAKRQPAANRESAINKPSLSGRGDNASSPRRASVHALNGSVKFDSPDSVKQPRTPRKKLKYEVTPNVQKGSVKGAEVSAFLRCHSKDPNDSVTQVWQAAFQPKGNENETSASIVATCGGRVVNFIDCSTGTVVKRYRHANTKEEFFCLAWTSLPIGGRPSAVLAVAGKACEVSLIHPEQLVCYRSFQAHSKYINSLLFCPNQPAWLLSGSIDDNIHIWNIGIPKAPEYVTKIEKLLTLRPKVEILQLCVSTKNELLLAACHGGLFAWKFDQKSVVKVDRFPNAEFCLPGKDGTSVEKEPVVDGLVLIQDDTIDREVAEQLLGGLICFSLIFAVALTWIMLRRREPVECVMLWDDQKHNCPLEFLPAVSKCSSTGMIGTWKLSAHVTTLKKHSQKLQKVKVKYGSTFLWSDTKVDYLYPSATHDVIACGDDFGSVWLYNGGKDGVALAKPVKKLMWPVKLSCSEEVSVEKKDGKVNANAVALSPDGNYVVVCTDINIVCIWKITR